MAAIGYQRRNGQGGGVGSIPNRISAPKRPTRGLVSGTTRSVSGPAILPPSRPLARSVHEDGHIKLRGNASGCRLSRMEPEPPHAKIACQRISHA